MTCSRNISEFESISLLLAKYGSISHSLSISLFFFSSFVCLLFVLSICISSYARVPVDFHFRLCLCHKEFCFNTNNYGSLSDEKKNTTKLELQVINIWREIVTFGSRKKRKECADECEQQMSDSIG